MNRMMAESLPSLDDAYDRFRPVLFRVLGALARKGYASPLIEGLELIHEFFIDAWPGLRERYDPSKGTPKAYVAGAFVRYARPRIVSMMRMNSLLVPALPDDRFKDESGGLPPGSTPDVHAVRRAMRRMSARDRDILEARFKNDMSEREAARKFSVSRYGFRKSSIEALAKLAVAIDEPGAIGSADWKLAKEIWGAGHSLAEASSRLDMTENQARLARRRVFQALSGAVSGRPGRPREAGRNNMQQEPCSLWRELIHNPGDQAVVRRVRENARELVEHAEDCERCASLAEEHSGSLAEIYESLGAMEEELGDRELAFLERQLRARIENESDVARAVNETLLPALPPRLRRIDELGHDVTPVSAFLAADAVSMAVHDHVRLSAPRGADVEMASDGSIEVGGRTALDRETLVVEIQQVARVERESADRLLQWVHDAAREYPRLFIGIDTVVVDPLRISLTLTRRSRDQDLFERWKPVFFTDASRAVGVREIPAGLVGSVVASTGPARAAPDRPAATASADSSLPGADGEGNVDLE